MKKSKLSLADYQVFLFISLLWLVLSWAGFIMSLTGFFYSSVLWISIAAAGIWLLRFIIIGKVYRKISNEMWVVGTIILLISALFSFSSLSAPTVFSGRDQGAISEAAVRLEQNHSLNFSTQASQEFFKIYGQGRALNFPGFHYTENGDLTTQFPLVYISGLAIFYSLFNTAGFAIANCILLFFFLSSFYLLARLFMKALPALVTLAFISTSFVFMWFAKFTLSENVALPLVWIGILSLVLFLCAPRKLNYTVFLASMMLICFARIEGLAFFAVSLFIIAMNKEVRDYITLDIKKRFLIPLAFFLAVFVANAIQDSSFYIEILKTLFPDIGLKAQPLGEMKNTVLPEFYALKIFYLYGLLGFFLFGLLGAIAQFWRNEKYRFVPFFIIAPTLIYFMNSHITPDHPWMLRRFAFSLLPAAILYSGFLIGHMLEKSVGKKFHIAKIFAIAITLLLLLGNLPAFSKYVAFSENKNLLEQTHKFSQKFSQNDLVLIDRKATGDGWAMISGPMSFLFGKNSVYFFNTQDLGKLDLKEFNNVYLIASDDKASYYLNSTIGEKLTFKEDYSLTFSKLNMDQDAPLKAVELPGKTDYTAQGKIFKVSKQ